jgi:hypothetical protein
MRQLQDFAARTALVVLLPLVLLCYVLGLGVGKAGLK